MIRVVVMVLALVGCPLMAAAQPAEARLQVGVQFVGVSSDEFDKTDLGVSGGIAWRPVTYLGLEAEMGIYPDEFADAPAFSRRRVEGLFGVSVGPRLGRIRPFVKVRPGFVAFGESPGPIACIAIFPPPLACALASGETVAAFDLGGGIEVFASDRTFLRLDVGDRVVRYPGTVWDSSGMARPNAFLSHDIRVAVGGGWRF